MLEKPQFPQKHREMTPIAPERANVQRVEHFDVKVRRFCELRYSAVLTTVVKNRRPFSNPPLPPCERGLM
jgi:hypothetical protein